MEYMKVLPKKSIAVTTKWGEEPSRRQLSAGGIDYLYPSERIPRKRYRAIDWIVTGVPVEYCEDRLRKAMRN